MATHLVSAAEMRALEAASVAAGASWAGLMRQAGGGVAAAALEELGDPTGRSVLVLAGPGNNGGDALVAASLLHAAGAAVEVALWQRPPDSADWPWHELPPSVREAALAVADRLPAALAAAIDAAALVVDGLLGIGVSRPLTGSLAALVALLNRAAAPVLAIDVPTGLDADTGAIWGTCVRATLTVATGLPKRGHHLYPGASQVGRLVVAPIDLPQEMENSVPTTEINRDLLRSLLPARPDDAHKDSFGRVLVLAGSFLYPGAAWLTATAATRSGVGVVTLACPRSIYGGASAALHEATFLPLPESEPGALSGAAVKLIRKHLGRYKALVIGPGLGQEESTGDVLSELLELGAQSHRASVGFLHRDADAEQEHHHRRSGFGFRSAAESDAAEDAEDVALPPLVLDADGLNLLAKIEDWQEHLSQHQVVVTPHPGEMARLLGVETIDADHPQVAADAAAQWGVTVVLKGPHTVVAAPDGQIAIHGVANPALATAGSGDVLSGLLGGLLAQGLAPFDAARLAVGVHAMAGQLAAAELGVRGVVAGDLLPRLPLAWRQLEGAE